MRNSRRFGAGLACLVFVVLSVLWWLPRADDATERLLHREAKSQPKENSGLLPAQTVSLSGYSPLILVHEPLIQSELDFTATQADQVSMLVNDFLANVRVFVEQNRDLAGLSPELQTQRATMLSREREMAAAKLDAKCLSLLSPAQIGRLEQVAFQLRVEEVFYEADVIRRLRLNKRQLETIAAKRRKLRTQAHLLYEASDATARDTRHLQIQALRRENLREFEDLLTADQALIYGQLRGEPIRFAHAELRLEFRATHTAKPAPQRPRAG